MGANQLPSLRCPVDVHGKKRDHPFLVDRALFGQPLWPPFLVGGVLFGEPLWPAFLVGGVLFGEPLWPAFLVGGVLFGEPLWPHFSGWWSFGVGGTLPECFPQPKEKVESTGQLAQETRNHGFSFPDSFELLGMEANKETNPTTTAKKVRLVTLK